MELIVKIYCMSSKFVHDYPPEQYPEIMCKRGRPYTCLLIQRKGYDICIPYRSDINHKNAFFFKKSMRSRKSRSGLDYSKILIIKDRSYFDYDAQPMVDQDEYSETMSNIWKIVKEAESYVDDYINLVRGEIRLHPRESERRYKYSTLKYFRKELGI